MATNYRLFPTPPGDWRNDVFELQSIRMAAIYNIIIRTLNSIIHHAPTIHQADVPAFMKYCHSLATFIRYHAMIEDFIFLYLEMNLPRGQGDLIPGGMGLEDLDSWARLCSNIREDNAKYHPDQVLDLLKRFADPMLVHMEVAMNVLDATLLKKHIQTATLESFETELEAKNRNDCLPFSAAPLLMVNSDFTHNPWFPPVPSPVIWVLRYIVIPLSSNTWKFSQCDTYMRPKNKSDLSYSKSAVILDIPRYITVGFLALALSFCLWMLLEHPTTP
ncbi:unnamed protein product [Rhizoctonia solani]|uniref:Hemerythrin-like domain-containing protein n=1 Tax=Rhizoctonia solani TaxID=456999 RepID=A0A8H3CZ87_9AGAM|nr:unnamed protein product [Rhizoctonia solani]